MPVTETSSDQRSIEAATMRKVGLRLIPFLVLCYFISYVDRVNVGFAALTMNKDLGLSAAAFGIGGAARAGRHGGPARLAVAAYRGGDPSRPARPRIAGAAAQPARGSAIPDP